MSFDLAEYTAEVDGVGTLRLLDAIRTCGLGDSVRFYQVLELMICSKFTAPSATGLNVGAVRKGAGGSPD